MKLTKRQLRSLINEVMNASFAQSVPGISDSVSDVAMSCASEIDEVYSGELDETALRAIENDIKLTLLNAVNAAVNEVYANIDAGKYSP